MVELPAIRVAKDQLVVWGHADLGGVVGTYSVAGTYPNGGHYTGTVVVGWDGNCYPVTWTVNGKTSVGRGLFLSTTLAVGSVAGDGGFVLAVSPKDGKLQGLWVDMKGDTHLGAESWTRT
jgi:hypothetical protein